MPYNCQITINKPPQSQRFSIPEPNGKIPALFFGGPVNVQNFPTPSENSYVDDQQLPKNINQGCGRWMDYTWWQINVVPLGSCMFTNTPKCVKLTATASRNWAMSNLKSKEQIAEANGSRLSQYPCIGSYSLHFYYLLCCSNSICLNTWIYNIGAFK